MSFFLIPPRNCTVQWKTNIVAHITWYILTCELYDLEWAFDIYELWKKKSKIDVESLHFIDENDRGFFDRVQIVVFHGLEIKKKIADAHNFFTH